MSPFRQALIDHAKQNPDCQAMNPFLITTFATLFGLAGEALLGFNGVSIYAFRIAGGLLLFITAIDMLFDRLTRRREGQHAALDHDSSVFPLATPLIAGPGAIASIILLIDQGGPKWSAKLAVLARVAAAMVSTLLFLLAAPPIEKLRGQTGTIVITRLLGTFLAALAVQFAFDRIRDSGLIRLAG